MAGLAARAGLYPAGGYGVARSVVFHLEAGHMASSALYLPQSVSIAPVICVAWSIIFEAVVVYPLLGFDVPLNREEMKAAIREFSKIPLLPEAANSIFNLIGAFSLVLAYCCDLGLAT